MFRKYIRENIKALVPYKSARSEFTGKAEVFLDANENPFTFSSNRYPDPYQKEVKQKLSELKSIEAERIFFGNGSDEIIDLLFRAFCEPKQDTVYTIAPSFSMYKFAGQLNNVAVRSYTINADFSIDADEFIKGILSTDKLIFLCTPNNPTGNSIPKETILKIAHAFDGLLVVDEAYIDFSVEQSLLKEKVNNIIVLQTFSKAWGSAGLRLGMAFMHPELVQILNGIKMPYNINQSTQDKALELLSNPQQVFDSISIIISERDRVEKEIKNMKAVQFVYPSDANFLLVRFDEALKMYTYLLSKGIIVRNRSTLVHCENCLRLTIGNSKENDALITAIQNYNL